MKRTFKVILTTIFIILAIVLLVGSYIYAGRVKAPYREIYPNRTTVRFTNKKVHPFLNRKDVLSLLPINPKDTVLRVVNTREMEKILEGESAYIKDANLYISPENNVLHIEIFERTPMLAYFTGGRSMYIDTDGILFPNRRGAAYVTVVTGDFSDKFAEEVLTPLGKYLYNHPKWQSFFGSINVVSKKDIRLFPRVGDFQFSLDPTVDFDEQFEKVDIFYEKILPKVGANKYNLIKLCYKNQIVCRRAKG